MEPRPADQSNAANALGEALGGAFGHRTRKPTELLPAATPGKMRAPPVGFAAIPTARVPAASTSHGTAGPHVALQIHERHHAAGTPTGAHVASPRGRPATTTNSNNHAPQRAQPKQRVAPPSTPQKTSSSHQTSFVAALPHAKHSGAPSPTQRPPRPMDKKKSAHRSTFYEPALPEIDRSGSSMDTSSDGDAHTVDSVGTESEHDSEAAAPPGDAANAAPDCLGDLSRGEDEFDYAILLKPWKFEDQQETEDAMRSDRHNQQQQPVAQDPYQKSVFAPLSAVKSQHNLKKNDPFHARNLITQRITRTGLQVKRLLSLDGKQTLLKVKAPQSVLEMGAERLKMRKLRKFDQVWMEFSCELKEAFADYDEATGMRFIDSEKQRIVHSLLTSDETDGVGAGLNEFCPLKSKYVVKMFPLHKEDLKALRKKWVKYWRVATDEPLTTEHEDASSSATSKATPSTKPARSTWCFARLVNHSLSQPIDHVAQYFGEKVAFYFAWIEMYTRWLIVPSIVGLVVFALQVHSRRLDHPMASFYAVFMALWTSAFLIAWKRQASTLAYRWGTLGYESVEMTRPEYYGDPALSNGTTKKYPPWKRYIKFMVTMPSVAISIVALLSVTYYAFSTRDRLEAKSIQEKAEAQHLAKDIIAHLKQGITLDQLKRFSTLQLGWTFWFYFFGTSMLYGLLIPILEVLFTRWARAMTNWENHPTETRYQSHLILKVFSFRFFHVFASMYYYAFANSTGGNNLVRVAVQLSSFMVSNQLQKKAMDTLYPIFAQHMHQQQKKRQTNDQFNQSAVFNVQLARGHRDPSAGLRRRNTNGQLGISNNAVIHEQCVRLEQASDKAWEEAELHEYDTFGDYTQMMIQIGYVSFFSLAFPLAPLLALVNNIFQIRTDAFKLCHAMQRPIAHKASGIGIWFQVLELMSVLAVLTSCLHIAFSTSFIEELLPHISAASKVWVVFTLEHSILALKVWMMFVIPAMPVEVKEKVRIERENAKLESARAMAAKHHAQLRAKSEMMVVTVDDDHLMQELALSADLQRDV